MAIDLETIRARVEAEGPVTRVVIAGVQGSAPRDVGAEMIVGRDGLSGTIGGGALEYEAIALARRLNETLILRRSLGPELGQCCGGNVTLVIEPWDTARIASVTGSFLARPVAPNAGEMPMEIRRRANAARSEGVETETLLLDGWLMEPVSPPKRPLWIWGAGHVGRALVNTLAPLPDFDIVWIDTSDKRFPDTIPNGVSKLVAADPGHLCQHAPPAGEHLVLTYSHAFDLAICDGLLRRGFGAIGLIGSKTKWARFQKRLSEMGHSQARISGIQCPIGDPALGKHPAAIAVGVAADLIKKQVGNSAQKEKIA